MMHGREKSDSAILAGKPTNKAVSTAAEPVERRAEAKGNASQQSTRRTRANSKQARVLGLLSRSSGATIATIMHSTGWQPHTVRGFFAAVVRKQLGLKLESGRTAGERVYCIVAGGTTADSAGEPSAQRCCAT